MVQLFFAQRGGGRGGGSAWRIGCIGSAQTAAAVCFGVGYLLGFAGIRLNIALCLREKTCWCISEVPCGRKKYAETPAERRSLLQHLAGDGGGWGLTLHNPKSDRPYTGGYSDDLLQNGHWPVADSGFGTQGVCGGEGRTQDPERERPDASPLRDFPRCDTNWGPCLRHGDATVCIELHRHGPQGHVGKTRKKRS
jgi:hypothetical protein